jgi:hypothetical protein
VLYTRIAPDRARPYGHKVPEGADVLNVIFGCTLMSDLPSIWMYTLFRIC